MHFSVPRHPAGTTFGIQSTNKIEAAEQAFGTSVGFVEACQRAAQFSRECTHLAPAFLKLKDGSRLLVYKPGSPA